MGNYGSTDLADGLYDEIRKLKKKNKKLKKRNEFLESIVAKYKNSPDSVESWREEWDGGKPYEDYS